MPRVNTATKSPRATKRPYVCTGCREEITAGQKYYTWSRRYQGARYRHVSCGFPRPTELSSRKTAQVEEAVQDAEGEIQNWTQEPLDGVTEFTEQVELDVSDLETILDGVADEAESVASEYEDGVQNMPEGLQYSPTAEAMTDVAERLNDWAGEMRGFEPDNGTAIDLPDQEDHLDEKGEFNFSDWLEAAEQAVSDAVDQARSDAQDKLSDMPEYEG